MLELKIRDRVPLDVHPMTVVLFSVTTRADADTRGGVATIALSGAHQAALLLCQQSRPLFCQVLRPPCLNLRFPKHAEFTNFGTASTKNTSII